jgi:glucose-6-phosphate isomerase
MPGFSQASDLQAWKELQKHHEKLSKTFVLKDQFKADKNRFEKYSHTFTGPDGVQIVFDFSKNFLADGIPEQSGGLGTLDLLLNLAKEAGLEGLRDEMFAGEKINFTEKRAVYHVALRNTSNDTMSVEGKSVVSDVNSVLEHMKTFSEQVRSGEWKGYTGKKIDTIVNIGIGGSDL